MAQTQEQSLEEGIASGSAQGKVAVTRQGPCPLGPAPMSQNKPRSLRNVASFHRDGFKHECRQTQENRPFSRPIEGPLDSTGSQHRTVR